MKTLRYLLVLIFLQVWGGVVLGQTPEVTLDFTKNGWNLPTSNTTTAKTYKNADGYEITIKVSGGNYKFSSNYLIWGKSGSTLTLPAFDFDVEKIIVYGNNGASPNTKLNFYVGTTPVSTETTGSAGTNTYDIAEDYQSAGTRYVYKISSAHNAQITKIEIYKKESSEPTPEATALELSENTPVQTEYYAGDAFSTEGLAAIATFADESTQDVTSAVTWTCEPATIAEDTKTVIVTATYKGLPASKTYDITVKSIANTAETAYTVEEAVALIDANKGLNAEVYVKGIVSSVAKFNNSYGQIDYYISSDGTEEAQQFECYNGLNIGGAKFTSIDEIEVGAEIVAKGQLTKYGSTYELARGNELVSYKMATKALTSLAIAGTPAKLSYSAGEAPSADGLTVEATFDDGSTQNVTGKVVWTFTPETITENCTVTAIATYQEVSASTKFDVTVRTITGISISGTPQTVYQVGANPSADGLTVEATFSDETTQDVTADVTWTFDPETIAEGTTQVTATAEYEGFTASKTIDITISTQSVYTLDLTTKTYTSASTEQVVWNTGVGTMISERNGSANTAVNNYLGGDVNKRTSSRVYKGNLLTITSNTSIAKVIFTATTSSYATAFYNSTFTNAGKYKPASGTVVELVPTNPNEPIKVTIGATCGFSQVVIYTTVNATISDAGYATLCLPYAAVIPDGVTVYAAKDNGTTVTLTAREDGVIAAEEGVVLQGKADTYSFAGKLGAVEKMSGNEMVGVTEATPLSTANGVYLLSRNKTTNKTAFRLLETDYTLGANKAYLKPASVSYSRLMIDIDDNVETGIDAVNGQEDASRPKVIYNLAGQRMSRTTKGINIVNGKLVLQ